MAGTPVGATPGLRRPARRRHARHDGRPPTVAAVTFGTTTANYNPPSDPGGASGRRWGDYSFTSVDPLDDMTVVDDPGVQPGAEQLRACASASCRRRRRPRRPAPASPIAFAGPHRQRRHRRHLDGGSGFYDPGANLPAPGAAVQPHLGATVTNAIVNSVTYNSPTQVTLNITALATGSQNVTHHQPRRPGVTANGCINVAAAAVADLAITKTDGVTTATPGGSVTYTITATQRRPEQRHRRDGGRHLPGRRSPAPGPASAPAAAPAPPPAPATSTTPVNLPAGGSVTYTATCTISAAATGTLSNTATVTAPAGVTDPTPGNNSRDRHRHARRRRPTWRSPRPTA